MTDVRKFETGAVRDNDAGKLDFEGFYSPLVMEAYAEYMQRHQTTPDGKHRPGDNWQHGMPREVYMKSAWRHFFDWWKAHRGLPIRDSIADAICALLFNAQGYLHEHLVKRHKEAA